jgi:hypothetical protein
MSSTPPPGPPGDADLPSFAEENANRVASESIVNYDSDADVYHCSYGPPIPAATVHDPERELLVRIDPATRQVVGFSIPNFRAWYAANADEDGSFGVDLPSIWAEDDTGADQ